MNPESWTRIKDALPDLLELSGAEREARLATVCAGDAELEVELRALLGRPAEGFLEPPDVDLVSDHDTASLPPGFRLAEFEIVEEIGRGGMGVVYRARQPSLDRDIALKVLTTGALGGAQQASRFAIEGIAAASLAHPHIVRVLSAGEAQGHRYIAMELVEGGDLHQALEQLRREARSPLPGPDDPEHAHRVAEVVRDIADALGYAHEHGILHRDIKPQNILLDADGMPFLVDFGLAKDLRADSISVSGQILGTPYYMSPEQALARRVEIDHRTDIFSLGAVLYEALTLQRPFDGDSLERVLQAISFSEPASLRKLNPRIHRDLETICIRALEKDPAKRFPDAAAFAHELGRFLAHEPLTIRRTPQLVRLARRCLKHRVATSIGAALVLVLLSLPFLAGAVRSGGIDTRLDTAEARLGSLEVDELRLSLDQVRELELERLSDEQRGRAQAIRAAVRARGEELKARGLTARERALDPALVPDPHAADRQLDIAQGQLYEARMLLPHDEELARLLAEGVRSTLTVDTEEPGLRVTYSRFDAIAGTLGETIVLGTTPLETAPIVRGVFRLTVERPGGAFAELPLVALRRGESHVIEPVLEPTDTVVEGMVRVEGAEISIELDHRPVEPVRVKPFWIDATEVTIGQFRRFMRETGHPGPSQWRHADLAERYDEILRPAPKGRPDKRTEWDDHPVSGVTLAEARAYAAWCGKRLPTVFEWDLAARGAELRPYPWTADHDEGAAQLAQRAVLRDPDEGPFLPRDDLDPVQQFLDRAASVASHPDGRTPTGLYHMLGNVKEWTESVHVDLRPDPDGGADLLVQDPTRHHIRGCAYDVPAVVFGQPADLTFTDKKLVTSGNFSVGFRCAKSVR